MNDPAIELKGVEKRYGRIEALRGVDLEVGRGEVFGLIGPNGAGKSTLIKALTGALKPTGGSVRVLGLDPLKDRAQLRQRIGYMPQSPVLYGDLSARENVAFFGAAHGTDDLARRVARALEFTELSERADDRVHTFSGGMKHRVSLACALVHSPTLLLLDEPSAGVDPQLRNRFWKQFRELASQGTTLFVTTHLMEEAMLCDRIAILRQGQVVAGDTPDGLLQRGSSRIRITRNGTAEEIAVPSGATAVAAALHDYGLDPQVSALRIDQEPLEQVVLSMMAERETGDAAETPEEGSRARPEGTGDQDLDGKRGQGRRGQA